MLVDVLWKRHGTGSFPGVVCILKEGNAEGRKEGRKEGRRDGRKRVCQGRNEGRKEIVECRQEGGKEGRQAGGTYLG